MNECPSDERLGAYLDGELAADAAQAVASHLETCSRCAGEIASLRELEQLSRHLTAPEVSDEEWLASWNAIAARVAPAPAESPSAGLWQKLYRVRLALAPVAAAAALLALALGVRVLDTRSGLAQPQQCVVESVETAAGYTSMYYHSDEADVTIITLVPTGSQEDSSTDESREPL